MPDEFKVQESIKAGADMLNIRAGNAAEFASLRAELVKQPELAKYFPGQPKVAVLDTKIDPAPILEKGSVDRAEAIEEQSTPQSALEIAREKAKARLVQKEA